MLLPEGCAGLPEPGGTALLEGLLRECGTWAHVDLPAPFTVGPLLLCAPAVEAGVRRWAADPGQRVRRGGVLAFLLPLRRQETFPRWFPAFSATVDPLLGDDRSFVREAAGWALRGDRVGAARGLRAPPRGGRRLVGGAPGPGLRADAP
ncbi:DNA alkylation repair protein [Streptomyces sp. NPDC001380]|uniref:DNA alkylation repair protein n=1 Tax=Streptomyces sp. NPDC001380 TaxID=3364566 RepID=UPI00367F8B1D